MIDSKRLSDQFVDLVQVDSISRKEKKVALMLKKILTGMGATVCFDDAKDKVGGDCSNLIAKFQGTVKTEPIFLCGHMDTVEPGEGIKVQFEDGVFKSDGTTILGSDDKSAIAIILEVMQVILENKLDHPPIEVIFTVCEEIGLLGAKHLDYSLFDAKFGYILDSTDTEGIVTRAPSANKITIKVFGKAAHAGAAPEKGIDAIALTSKAISKVRLGRIDEETTCNLGTIQGGVATNIVPEYVEIHGEARSHDPEKLDTVTRNILDAFEQTATAFADGSGYPKIESEIELDFSHTHIPEDHPVVTLAREAASNLGMALESKTIGGGADANIFFGKGIAAGVLGTGMTDVHTLNESIKLDDMVRTANLVLEILKLHTKGKKS